MATDWGAGAAGPRPRPTVALTAGSIDAGSALAGSRTAFGRAGTLAAGGTAMLAIIFILVATVAGVESAIMDAGARSAMNTSGVGVSAIARADIPARYLRLYIGAGRRYGLDWAVLAGIGRIECDHGRDRDPSCTRDGVFNAAGAGGPMQFIAPTWARYGVDGNGDGRINRWDPVDAVYSAANYLRASGAPGDTRAALFAYNHAGWYVEGVERWAARYRGPELSTEPPRRAALPGQSPTPIEFVAGERAVLVPGDGHLALVPVGVPAVVQAMVVAGNELQALPYGPGGHPDPRGAYEEDCSSTVNYLLYRSRVRPIGEIVRDNPLARDYLRWGMPGPGRWVTIYATRVPSEHVFIVIAGLRLDTARNGIDVGPNRNEDGPRWRILDHIPTWAHWSVRHPQGL